MTSAKIKTATLGGTVWNDINHDGLQNDGNIGIAGVKVLLLNDEGKATGKFAITDVNGNYSFTGLKPGEYSVKFDIPTLPNGATFTQKDVGHNNNVDSDANVTTGKTGTVELKAGDVNTSVDAGVVLPEPAPVTISGHSWSDLNGNGIQDPSEPVYPNAPIDIYKLDSNNAPVLVFHTSTDSNGAYTYTDSAPGQFFVHVAHVPIFDYTLFHKGGNELLDSDIDPTTGNSDLITLAVGESTTAIDVGLVSPGQLQPGTITGHVWKDDNSNGIQDPGEAGYAGVNVILLDSPFGTLNTFTTTDSNGDYVFTNVTPADYLMQFAESNANYITPTLLHQGTDPNKDSDYDPGFVGTNNLVTVHAGETIKFDAGYLKAPPINIGATRGVWLDVNGDSLKDADATLEPGIEGVTVTLIDRGADGVFGGVDDTVIATTTTNSNGDYNFPNVERAAYALVFSKPGSTITFTAMHNDNLTRGDIASDSDANGLGQVIVVDNTQPDFISAGIISIVGTPAAASIDTLLV